MDKKTFLCLLLVVISSIGCEAATDFSVDGAKDWLNSKCASIIAVLAILIVVLIGCLVRCEGNPSMFLSSNFLQSLLSLTNNKDGTLIIKGTQEVRKGKFEIYQTLRFKDSAGNQNPLLKNTTKPENEEPRTEPNKDANKPEDKEPKDLKPEGDNSEEDSKPWTERLKDSVKPLKFWAKKPEDKEPKDLNQPEGENSEEDSKPWTERLKDSVKPLQFWKVKPKGQNSGDWKPENEKKPFGKKTDSSKPSGSPHKPKKNCQKEIAVTAIITTIITAAIMAGLIALALHSEEVAQHLKTAGHRLSENFNNAKTAMINKF